MRGYISLLCWVCLSLHLWSCRSESTQISPSEVVAPEEQVSFPIPEVENGYLVFQDWNHAYWFRDKVKSLDLADQPAFEAEVGYTSIRTTYNQFEEWSAASVETGYGVSFEDLEEQYRGTLLFDEEWDFKMDLWSPVYAEIVNETGWVRVADTLYLMSRAKKVQLPADIDPAVLRRARNLRESSQTLGIKVVLRPPYISAPRARCSYYGIMSAGAGIYTLFSNAWLFQDPSNGNGRGDHEWKLEVAYEAQRNPSNHESVVWLDVKYRRRGFLGAWYATKPRNWSSDGTSTMKSSHSTPLTTSAVHTKGVINFPCCSSWEHFVYSDRAGDNPDTNPPDINTSSQGWDEDCYDFDLTAEFEGDDGNWYPQSVGF